MNKNASPLPKNKSVPLIKLFKLKRGQNKMKNKNLVWASFNYFEFQLPQQAVNDCSHQGECFEDVEFWQRKIELNVSRDLLIKELREYGAWDIEELTNMDDIGLEQKIIWIAACNIKEEQFSNNEDK
jgi:hypothetical protein